MNVEYIVWKDNNLDQKVVSNTQTGGNPTIRKINYHVTDVGDKKVHHNLTYKLTSSRLTLKI